MSKKALKLSPWKEVRTGNKLRWCTQKPEKKLDVPGLKVIGPVNDRFVTAVENQNYGLLKKSSGQDYDVAHKPQKMAKWIAVQTNYRISSGKESILVIVFLQEFKSVGDACGIHKGAIIWLSKQYLAGPAETAVKPRVTLTNSAKFYQEDPFKSYSTIVQFLPRRFFTDDNKANPDAEVHNLRQASITTADVAQELWKKRLICASIYDDNSLEALFVEGAAYQTRKTFRDL